MPSRARAGRLTSGATIEKLVALTHSWFATLPCALNVDAIINAKESFLLGEVTNFDSDDEEKPPDGVPFPTISKVDSRQYKYHIWYHSLIRIHNDATSDLAQIRTVDPVGFGKLLAFIEQLRKDPRLVSKLLDHGFGADPGDAISVMRWLDVRKVEKLPLWRVKSWSLERQGLRYRIIYCYNWPDRSYNIMAVVPRSELNYDDPQHPIRQRVTRRVRAEFPDA